MVGGAVDAVCPPGFLCMNTPFLVGLIVCLAAAVFFFTRKMVHDEPIKKPEQQTVKVIVERQQPMKDPRYPPPPDKEYTMGSDTRGYNPPPGVPVIPIQIPTRGLPEEFQQLGVLTTQGGSSTSASPNRTLLPLIGRRVAVSNYRFNYYTRTDGFNPVQVPVTFKKRSCDDDNGCDEIMNGDSIGVPLLGQTFVATIYKNNTPRYIPLI
jgi:hypothetical protein